MQGKLAARQGLWPRSMPHIIYSQSRRDVTAQELAMLLFVAKDQALSSGSWQRRSLFAHWSSLAFDEHARERVHRKLARALDNSHAMVAAFANYDVYENVIPGQAKGDISGSSPSSPYLSQPVVATVQQQQQQQRPPSTLSEPASSPAWTWLIPAAAPEGRPTRRRSLVGFVRAAGDKALACTIYDLAVHPEFRRYGIGSKLLRVLAQQLYNKEMYDIGSVVPLELEPLFRRCNFDDDREASTTMTFTQHQRWVDEGLVPAGPWSEHFLLIPAWHRSAQQQQHRHTGSGDCYSGSSWSYHQVGPGQFQEEQLPATDTSRTHNHAEASTRCADNDGGVACSATWPGDNLQYMPCPATKAIQNSNSLHNLLLRKLDQQLG